MWLFTRYGFYSIACAHRPDGSPDPDAVMIRGRSLDHLENLQQRFATLAGVEILNSPQRDYRFRIIVPKDAWTAVVGELAAEQQWSNFKRETGRYQGREGAAYVRALHEVWQVMADFQEKGDR
jgi:hypothetical protein